MQIHTNDISLKSFIDNKWSDTLNIKDYKYEKWGQVVLKKGLRIYSDEPKHDHLLIVC